MKSTIISLLILVCLLTSVLVFVQTVHAQTDSGQSKITINADGSINPATAPIVQAGNTYTLTGNIEGTIEIERSNVIFNGGGYTITNPLSNSLTYLTPIGWSPGIEVQNESNIVIRDTDFNNSITGINIVNSSNVTFTDNYVREATDGIAVSTCSGLRIVNDLISNFSNAIAFYGFPSAEIDIEGNTIIGNGNVNLSLTQPPSPQQWGIWGIINDSWIVGNNITEVAGPAIYQIGSNNIITGNSFEYNNDGIFLNVPLSANNIVYSNNFINCINGYVCASQFNTWDNGATGNYWSDYQTKTLNESQPGASGTWNIAYGVSDNNLDHYPLIQPITISVVTPALTQTPITTPTPSSSANSNSTPSPIATPASAPTPAQISNPTEKSTSTQATQSQNSTTSLGSSSTTYAIPEFSCIAMLCLCIFLLLIAIVVRPRKTKT